MSVIRLATSLCIAASALMAQSTCLTVTGDQITGKDLARAVPAFAGIPKNTPLAPAPLAGSSRVFSTSELESLAARFSTPALDSREVCFRFATEPLDRNRIEEAMRRTLRMPEAKIEILDTSAGMIPVGTLEFMREGLGAPAGPDQSSGEMWRGDVMYAGGQKYQVWAKVRVTVPTAKWAAIETLKPGVRIRPNQIRMELVERFPQSGVADFAAEQITDMTPLRSVAAGAEIRRDNLIRPNDVDRGDLVQVAVHFGAAHLALTGRAESAGHLGDMVAIRNLETNKLFEALVSGPGKVIVGKPGVEVARKEAY